MHSSRPSAYLLSFLLPLVAALGCTGRLSNPDGDAFVPPNNAGPNVGGNGAVGATSSVGVYPVQRMTRRELTNTLRYLFKDPTLTLPDSYPGETAGSESGFPLAANNVATLDVREFRGMAESIAVRATQDLPGLTGCAATVNDTCLGGFIKSFGRRAYRHPLSATELKDFLDLHTAALAAGAPEAEAVAVVVESFLQSPHFMIKFEVGDERAQPAKDAVALTRYQLASRLAFFLSGSAPDDALIADTDADKLSTVADLERVASRLLSDEAHTGDLLGDFDLGWLELRRLSGLHKDATRYPSWDQQTNDDLSQALDLFTTEVVMRGDGTFQSLLTAPFAFANQRLAPLYGKSLSGDAFVKIDLDASQRRGLLLQAPFLATTGAEDGSLPPRRGERIYKHLLCGTLGPPPMVIPPLPPADASLKTTRQRFEQQHSGLSCGSACHTLIDPVGFPFEHFAGGGDYRALDNGEPVDASGTVTTPGGATFGYRDGTDFVSSLAALPEVQACYAAHWYRYAVGRREIDSEQAELAGLSQRFTASGTRIKDLLVAIASSRPFRLRAPVEGETL